ncbi:MAG: class I SAM-dependent methyltransferase [Desulfobacteraceae bacterium]|nr:MAG: class I SAM-dependent methyltransferase [Desulfobacteraceae bacterium]
MGRYRMSLSEKEIVRINETVKMIPLNIISLLEVGCGDGRVAQFLPDAIKITGFDINKEKIKHYPGNKIIADISKIPIKQNTFDLVLITEVLEHLNDKIYRSALSEILRITKQYILITVPFYETLSANWDKCSECGHIFHAWGHIRKFNPEILKHLFKNATLQKTQLLSPKETWIPSAFYKIAKKLGKVWGTNPQNPTLCPICGSGSLHSTGNLFGKIFIRFLWRFEKYSPIKKPIWIGCLYEKNVH